MRSLWCAVLVLVAVPVALSADQSKPRGSEQPSQPVCSTAAADPNDPNELLKKYDAVVKNPADANELLRVKWDSVVSVLQAKHIPQKTKEVVISRMVSPIFDFALMSKLVLGRENWPKFTTTQRERFTKVFTKRLKNSYREKISHYTDEVAALKPAVPKGKALYIPMELISQGKKIAIVYKLRRLGKRWLIFDVEIQGVSILLTYRSQFDDILRKETPEDLISRMAKPPKP